MNKSITQTAKEGKNLIVSKVLFLWKIPPIQEEVEMLLTSHFMQQKPRQAPA